MRVAEPIDQSNAPRPTSSSWGRRALASLLSGLLLVALALGVGWLFQAASVPLPVEPITPASDTSFPANGSPPLLVDAAGLADLAAADTELVILDLSDPRRYDAEHVPGAVHGWWQDTMSPFADVYGRRIQQSGGPLGVDALFESWGIGPDSTVVAYDDDANRYAARVVWLLRAFGHPRATVLDGGLAAWKGAGQRVSDEPATATTTSPLDAQPREELTISTTELQERYADPALTIIDVRSPSEAADDLNGTIRVGMIPGAIRLPWNDTVRDASGALRPPSELTARLQAAGISTDPNREIVLYGRFGVETGQTWLVLSLLGYGNIRIYDEGWASWAAIERLPIDPLPANPGTPIATPAAGSSRGDTVGW